MDEKPNDNEIEAPDEIEEALKFALENRGMFLQLLEVMKKLQSSGLLDELQTLFSGFVPSDHTIVTSYLSSEEGLLAISKLLNIMPAVGHTISSEKTSDLIKLVLFNSEKLTESMIDGAKNPQNFGLLKLMSLLKDPEFTAGLTAMINLIGTLGQIISKANE